MDKALVCVSYDTLCRRSETVAIRVEDISFADDGSGSVNIIRSKTDQIGEGAVKYLSHTTAEHLKNWLAATTITEGYVFLGLNRWQQVLPTPLSGEGVTRSLRRVAARSGFAIEKISGHSTRVGVSQDLVAAGIDMPAIMQAGSWINPERVARYSDHLLVKRGGMAQLATLQRRIGLCPKSDFPACELSMPSPQGWLKARGESTRSAPLSHRETQQKPSICRAMMRILYSFAYFCGQVGLSLNY
ncbi:MAG: tyrosine-type recombinase/integrase [Methylomonas sp.]